jgi:cytochrome c peroxidase
MRWLLSSSLLLSLFAACSSEAAQAKVDPLKAPLGLGSVELVTNPDNPLTVAKAELGKQLFFDARLSGTGKMACNSCHLPGAGVHRRARRLDEGRRQGQHAQLADHAQRRLPRPPLLGRPRQVARRQRGSRRGRPRSAASPKRSPPSSPRSPEYQKAFQAAFGPRRARPPSCRRWRRSCASCAAATRPTTASRPASRTR